MAAGRETCARFINIILLDILLKFQAKKKRNPSRSRFSFFQVAQLICKLPADDVECTTSLKPLYLLFVVSMVHQDRFVTAICMV